MLLRCYGSSNNKVWLWTVFIISISLILFYPYRHESHAFVWDSTTRASRVWGSLFDRRCDWMPDVSNIQVNMRTGATVAYARIPIQLVTALSCVPPNNMVIFSDMDDTMGETRVADSIDTYSLPIESNKDFDLYRWQKQCSVDIDSCSKTWNFAGYYQPWENPWPGWHLDKYKPTHMTMKAWEFRPGVDWYLFVDDDTYVVWNTVVEMFRHLDPNQPARNTLRAAGYNFASGGSGYALSRAAMEIFAERYPTLEEAYDKQVNDFEGGDVLLGKLLAEMGIPILQAFPSFSAGMPYDLNFGPANESVDWMINVPPPGPVYWCHPIVTFHHMAAEGISQLYNWERSFTSRNPHRPFLLRDVFNEFLRPKWTDHRDDWDNRSDDIYYLNSTGVHALPNQAAVDRIVHDKKQPFEQDAILSYENCHYACKQIEECFQFKFSDGICALSKMAKFGVPRASQKEIDDDGSEFVRTWKSGWMLDRIDAWFETAPKCEEASWMDWKYV